MSNLSSVNKLASSSFGISIDHNQHSQQWSSRDVGRRNGKRGDKETGGRKGSDEFEGFILNK